MTVGEFIVVRRFAMSDKNSFCVFASQAVAIRTDTVLFAYEARREDVEAAVGCKIPDAPSTCCAIVSDVGGVTMTSFCTGTFEDVMRDVTMSEFKSG